MVAAPVFFNNPGQMQQVQKEGKSRSIPEIKLRGFSNQTVSGEKQNKREEANMTQVSG